MRKITFLRRLPVVFALLALTFSSEAAGDRQKTGNQAVAATTWRLTGLAVFAASPFLFVVAPGIELEHIYHRDESPLWDKLHIKGRLSALATPTAPGAQLDVEWMPLLPVILRARYSLLFFTGAEMGIGPGMGFASSSDPFDGDTLSSRQGEEEAEVVQRATLSLTLRGKLWRILASNELELAGWYVPGGSGTFWYEQYYDSMVARGKVDATLANKSMLLLQAWSGEGSARLLVGALNEYSRALRSRLERDRLGGVVVWTPADELLGIDRPTIIVASGATLVHRHRKNDFWIQAVMVFCWDL